MPLQRYLVLPLLLLVSACAQLPQRPPGNAWVAPEWSHWSLRGRIAVQAGEQGWHANLNWRQTGVDYVLELSGPLGQGTVRMSGNSDGVTLERADGLRDWAPDADELLTRNTGWTLPVAGLRYWVRGRAAPGQPAQWQWSKDGLPQQLRQDGWLIRYSEFREQAGHGLLPRKLELERAGLSARIVIDGWSGSGQGG